jgi:transposase
VGKWVKAYRKGGLDALKAKKRGNPKLVSSLTTQQSHRIKDLILDYTPEQFSLPFHLWNKEVAAQLIKQQFGLQISKSTSMRYLTSWDYLLQEPSPRDFCTKFLKENPWYKENYYKIFKQAKREKAKILWFYKKDLGSALQLRALSSPLSKREFLRSLSKREKDKLRRRKCNTFYAITNRGRTYFLVYKKSLNRDVFLDFLNRLFDQMNYKIFLIMEPYGVSNDKKVQDWIDKKDSEIRLFTTEGLFFT